MTPNQKTLQKPSAEVKAVVNVDVVKNQTYQPRKQSADLQPQEIEMQELQVRVVPM